MGLSSDSNAFVLRIGQIIGSPEEVAYEQGFITAEQLATLADPLKKSGYGNYLC